MLVEDCSWPSACTLNRPYHWPFFVTSNMNEHGGSATNLSIDGIVAGLHGLAMSAATMLQVSVICRWPLISSDVFIVRKRGALQQSYCFSTLVLGILSQLVAAWLRLFLVSNEDRYRTRMRSFVFTGLVRADEKCSHLRAMGGVLSRTSCFMYKHPRRYCCS